METCLFVKNGIEAGIWMASRDLENHLLGEQPLRQKDIGNLFLLKIAMPTLKKVCEADNMIKPVVFEEYSTIIDRILKDMEDYAE